MVELVKAMNKMDLQFAVLPSPLFKKTLAVWSPLIPVNTRQLRNQVGA